MGLIFLNRHKKYQFGVWEINESLIGLSDGFKDDYFNKLKNNKRKLEYVCTRLLLKEFESNLKISYNKYGAPILNNNKCISISHSNNLAAIIISDKKVGIDIEKISKKPLKIADKFISENDNISMDTNDTCLAWSAKEAIYKLYEIGGLDFKNDILIQNINKEKNIIRAKFKNKTFFLNYQKINSHFLVYVCN